MYSEASSINNSGQAVGSASDGNNVVAHAVLFSNGTVTELNTLKSSASGAFSINNSGQVAGWVANLVTSGGSSHFGPSHATIWENGTAIDLNELVDLAAGWNLMEAHGINDLGQIACLGTINGGGWISLLLTPDNIAQPVPEPSTFLLFFASLCSLAATGRRK